MPHPTRQSRMPFCCISFIVILALPVAHAQKKIETDDLLSDYPPPPQFPGGVSAAQGAAGRVIHGDNIMISWSKDNDQLRGFSKKRGEWIALTIEKQEQIIPVVGSDVAFVRVGDSVAAFSANLLRWDVLPLSKGSKAQPVVSSGLVQVQDGDQLYTFAAGKGSWTSPTDPEFQKLEIVYEVKHPGNKEISKRLDAWVNSIDKTKHHGVVMSNNNQFTIHANRRSWGEAVKAKLVEWDVPAPTKADPFSNEVKTPNVSSMADLNQRIENLKLTYAEAESQVTNLVKQLRAQKLPSADQQEALRSSIARLYDARRYAEAELQEKRLRELKSPSADQQKALRLSIARLFDARHDLQKAELQRSRLKIKQVEQNLAARAKNRDRIVDRRLEELLNPNVNWEAMHGGSARKTAGSPNAKPVTAAAKQNPTTQQMTGRSHSESSSLVVERRSENSNATNQLIKDLIECRRAAEEVYSGLEFMLNRIRQGRTQLAESGVDSREMSDRLINHSRQKAKESQASLPNLMSEWKQMWREYEARVRLAELNISECESDLQLAQTRMDDKSQLVKSGLISKSDLEGFRSAYHTSQLKLERAKVVYETLRAIERESPHLNPSSLDVSEVLKPIPEDKPKSVSN